MQIGQPGNILITMQSQPALDIDFICWGPFTSPTGACDGGLTAGTIIDCSYSGAAVEECDIPGALAGEFYILLITNFSNQPCEISFSQTNYGQPGAGTTNCNIVVLCSVVALGPTASACDPSTNTYSVSGYIDFSNPPVTGTLTITDVTAVPPISATFTAPFSSPQTYTLPNIPCDGLQHDLTASFSDSISCTLTEKYEAPDAICPTANMHGGGSICAYPSAVSNVYIDLTGAPPFDFTYAIDGVPQAPVTNYSGPYPYTITTSSPGTYTMVSVSNAACAGTVTGSATVTVFPVPVVTLDTFPPTCINTPPYPLTGGSPAGGTYLGTGVSGSNFDPSKAGLGNDTIIYRYTDLNGCTATDTATILVNQNPLLTVNNSSPVICSSQATNISLSANLPGSTCAWTASSASSGISGFSDGTGSSIAQTLTNSSFVSGMVMYVITAQSANCFSEPDTVFVTVKPLPDLSNNPLFHEICKGQTATVNLTSNVAGTAFTWTCTQISGNVTGWANNPGPPSTLISQLLNMTGFVQDSVTYHLTPTANGCTGPVYDYTVKVNPVPTLTTQPMLDTICSGDATDILLTATCAGTTYTWTAAQGAGNVTGFSDGAGDHIVQMLTNNINTLSSVLYTIIPSTSTCAGNDTVFELFVRPLPHLTNTPALQSQCNNLNTNITLTSDVIGTLFTWTCTPSSVLVTGWSDNSVPSISLNQQLSNSSNTAQTVTYHIVPTANGCPGPVTDYVVTVYPTATLTNAPASQSQCNNANTNINLTSKVAGTMFTWTCTPSSVNITGWANNDVPTSAINQVLVNTGINIEWATYQVTPTAYGCAGITSDYTVTVYPTATLTNLPASQSQCNNINTNITLTSNVAGTLFTWTCTPSSGNITGWTNNAVPTGTIDQVLTNTGFNVEWATYQVAPTANGCPGTTADYTVTVFPVANVIFTPNGQAFCSGGSTSIGISSAAAGASFTWSAAASGPSLSGYAPGSGNLIQQTLMNSGPYPETATYQVAPTANGCPGTPGSVIVTVNPAPSVTVTPCLDPVYSTNAQPVVLKGNVPVGGTWSGPGVSAGNFFPGIAGPGMHTLTYTYNNTWGCSGVATTPVTVTSTVPFVCGNTLTDIRDSQAYPTVLIGGQCWFSANLNYGNTVASLQLQRDNCIPEKYCYGDNPANCASVGGLYQWDELMKYSATTGAQGFCPPEWHVPTEADWNTLFSFYISNGFAGSPLKSTGYSGFNALLSGTRFNNVQWDFSNFAVMFWSSNPHSNKKAWSHGMNSINPSVSFYPSHRNNAFFVRCLHD